MIPANPLVSYLYELRRIKTGLPHGHLVCLRPAPTIITTGALLQLTSSVGSHIAILQIHADRIEDWSVNTTRELTRLARRYNFLLWEGGRLLHACPDLVISQSRTRSKEIADTARRRYVKDNVSVASWAGLATSWASAVDAQEQEADILIPVLKAAARSTVAEIAQVIRTEITVDKIPSGRQVDEDAGDSVSTCDRQAMLNLSRSNSSNSSPVQSDGDNEWLPRRESTISLTQTISQCSELSPGFSCFENGSVEDRLLLYPHYGTDALSSPPLLTRGLVLCLSPDSASQRRSSLAAARANRDFVVGFVSPEPWTLVSLRDNISDPEYTTGSSGSTGSSDNDSADSSGEQQEESGTFVVFSSLEVRLHECQNSMNTISTDDGNGSFASAPVKLLHAAIAQELKSRTGMSLLDGGERQGKESRSNLLHVPVVTIGLDI